MSLVASNADISTPLFRLLWKFANNSKGYVPAVLIVMLFFKVLKYFSGGKISSFLCVCVCVRARACVCVCVFIFFHREGFFRLQCVQDILERYGSTIFCCEYLFGCFCQVPSSPYLKMSYFTSKDENSSHQTKSDKWQKDTKDKEATLI